MIPSQTKWVNTILCLFTLIIALFTVFINVKPVIVNASTVMPPVIGDYQSVTVQLSGNTTAKPSSTPVNTVSITAGTTTDFKGLIAVDLTSGIVRITNAHPSGTFPITITAFDNNGATTTKTFVLNVQTSASCDQTNFKQTPGFGTNIAPQAVAAEDFDGDGKPDIATVGNTTIVGVSILRNISTNGVTNFAPKIDLTSSSAGLGITAADFDGDGKKDIVTANFYTPFASIYRNTTSSIGAIGFAPKVDFFVGGDPRSVTTADFDGDGKLDIVVANSGSNNVSVLRNISPNAGTISFAAALNIAVGLQPRSVTIGDFDGDSKIDIATANYSSGTISILRNTSASQGTISFAAKVDFTAGSTPGSTPNSLVAADLDADGKTDIAVGNFGFHVHILRNTSTSPGTFSFAPTVNLLVSFGVYAIVAKDLDNDGKVDLTTANYYVNNVSVLRNISAPGLINFESRQGFVASQSPTSIAAADFDGDGKADLTISNSKANNVSVLRNTSPTQARISFDAQTELGIGGEIPYSIAIGDLDNDGKQDLVTANYSHNISIVRNSSTIAEPFRLNKSIEFELGENTNPYFIAVRDLDGDGNQDIALTYSDSSNISILRNTTSAAGAFSFAAPLYLTVGRNPSYIDFADFDNDGKPDIAITNFDSNSVSILRNTSSAGALSFAPKIDLTTTTNDSSLVIRDFNADGKQDLAVTNRFGSTVSVFRNTTSQIGAISFAPKIDFNVNVQPLFITADDFDGDGRSDLAVTNFKEPNGIISILKNVSANGAEINFAPKMDFPITSNPEFNMIPGRIVTGDINNDRKADIIVINSALQVISLLKNTTGIDGTISFAPRIDVLVSAAISGLAIGDYNSDGKQDIVYSSYNSNNVGILQNPCTAIRNTQFDYDGDGRADISVFRPSSGAWYISRSSNNAFFGTNFGQSGDVITPADFDGDGRADISVFRNGFWYRINSSTNQFFGLQFGVAEDIPVPADYDGDGKADVAVFRPSNSTWYRINSSNDKFVAFKWGTTGDKPLIGDFDGDGKSDYAVFRPSAGAWYILRSTDNSFYGVNFGLSEDIPTPADYDGDGKTDISVFRPSAGSWYRLNSSTNQFFGQQFGISEDKPVAADYDGDGKADVAVFRPSAGAWYIQRSGSGFFAQQFGTNGDIPTSYLFGQ